MNCQFFPLLVLAFVSLCGCTSDQTPRGVTVKGKVTQGGQVLKPSGAFAPGAYRVELIFYSSDPNAPYEQTSVDLETGEFTLVGAGRGVKPGVYKVGVYVRNANFNSDELNGKFNQQNTPISVTIPEDKVGGTFELPPIDINNPGT